MRELTSKGIVKGFGFNPVIAFVRFTSNGTNGLQTLTDSLGVTSVTRTGAGAWTVQLSEGLTVAAVIPTGVYSDANYHELNVTTYNASGSFTLTHRTVAYGSIASPVANDTTGVTSFSLIIYGIHN